MSKKFLLTALWLAFTQVPNAAWCNGDEHINTQEDSAWARAPKASKQLILAQLPEKEWLKCRRVSKECRELVGNSDFLVLVLKTLKQGLTPMLEKINAIRISDRDTYNPTAEDDDKKFHSMLDQHKELVKSYFNILMFIKISYKDSPKSTFKTQDWLTIRFDANLNPCLSFLAKIMKMPLPEQFESERCPLNLKAMENIQSATKAKEVTRIREEETKKIKEKLNKNTD